MGNSALNVEDEAARTRVAAVGMTSFMVTRPVSVSAIGLSPLDGRPLGQRRCRPRRGRALRAIALGSWSRRTG